MSFILDALKKSELERQRQTVPGLMDTPSRTKRNRLPVWAVAIAALLAINLIVLSVVLLRRGTPSEPARHPAAKAAMSSAPTESADRAQAQAKPFSPMDQAPVYAPEIPVPADEAAPTRPSSAARMQASRPGAERIPAAPAARRQDPLLTDTGPSENQEVLPTINELSLSGAHALPELHLDVHVYATRAADRFVYINMRKYHEGAVLQEGPTLERIRRDGVVLNFQGMRFLVPRQ